MVLELKNVTKLYGMKVFTDSGEYFGDVEEVFVMENKLERWRIRSTRGSLLNKLAGNAKGVLVPQKLIRAVGDIVIMSKAAIPTQNTPEEIVE